MSMQERPGVDLRTYNTKINGEDAGGIAAEAPTRSKWIESTEMVNLVNYV